jgi:hypothetical protein
MAKQLGFLDQLQSAGAAAQSKEHTEAVARAASLIGKVAGFLEVTPWNSETFESIAAALRAEGIVIGAEGTANDGWKEFSHDGRRWQFDADQLAEWDEEDEAFFFHSYHQLAEPTPETLGALIDMRWAR